MAENFYERVNNTLTWKRIVGFNVILFLVMIIPLSIQLAQQDTENRSGAAGEVEAPVVTPPPNYPSSPPRIERVNAFFGKTGDTVVVLGANFGEYKWGSKVYVGNVEAMDSAIVRWSNSVLEVKIPDSARTGKVWVTVNGNRADWEGNLLLYDVTRSAQVGLRKVESGKVAVYVSNAAGTVRGMVELGYVSEPLIITPGDNVQVTAQTAGADSLGKKMQITWQAGGELTSTQTTLFTVSYPGIGSLELLRMEMFSASGGLIPVYANPLNVKVLP
ncbi:MAG: Transglutaminase domain-containing protein [Microgenomates group bacterium GW2011_GWD1_47_13]|jgi:hypothetical protein|nr:MAG: Transglutaminase domain-containing protein [Microgenomates group bacterium GW2011_GWA1_46_7]KKU62702.1 MAG: Transglutaminase domain-containing protein [Microgenomates group bacterium GW2011_GWD1_47_13]